MRTRATHAHGDHYAAPLLDAMIQARKPCVTRWWPNSTVLNGPTTMQFGKVSVDVTIGDHHFSRREYCNDMLMFYVYEAGASLLHIGDNSNIDKLPADRPGLFMFHCCVGLPVADAIRRVDPQIALPAHVLELGHSPHPPYAWRWSYDFAHQTVSDFPAAKAPLLSWGERILTPGTELAS
jgi:hypothetical protein